MKVQFESGLKIKFLESLFQPMTLISNYKSVPQTHIAFRICVTYVQNASERKNKITKKA